jgi:hypothetical protein
VAAAGTGHVRLQNRVWPIQRVLTAAASRAAGSIGLGRGAVAQAPVQINAQKTIHR